MYFPRSGTTPPRGVTKKSVRSLWGKRLHKVAGHAGSTQKLSYQVCAISGTSPVHPDAQWVPKVKAKNLNSKRQLKAQLEPLHDSEKLQILSKLMLKTSKCPCAISGTSPVHPDAQWVPKVKAKKLNSKRQLKAQLEPLHDSEKLQICLLYTSPSPRD